MVTAAKLISLILAPDNPAGKIGPGILPFATEIFNSDCTKDAIKSAVLPVFQALRLQHIPIDQEVIAALMLRMWDNRRTRQPFTTYHLRQAHDALDDFYVNCQNCNLVRNNEAYGWINWIFPNNPDLIRLITSVIPFPGQEPIIEAALDCALRSYEQQRTCQAELEAARQVIAGLNARLVAPQAPTATPTHASIAGQQTTLVYQL